jgi:hypothetical protein
MQWLPQLLPESAQLYLQLCRWRCMTDELIYSWPKQGYKLFYGDTINLHLCMDHVVDIASRYGLDGPGIVFWWRRDFLHMSSLALGPTQPPIKWVPGLFPGGKARGAWLWQSSPYSTEVKERVELYLYSPSRLTWPVLGWGFIQVFA